MKTTDLYDCTVIDLKNALNGVKGKKKVFIRGLNDITVKILDDGNISICDIAFTQCQQDTITKVKETFKDENVQSDDILIITSDLYTDLCNLFEKHGHPVQSITFSKNLIVINLHLKRNY